MSFSPLKNLFCVHVNTSIYFRVVFYVFVFYTKHLKLKIMCSDSDQAHQLVDIWSNLTCKQSSSDECEEIVLIVRHPTVIS